MSDPVVTIVVSPRERFSFAERSLESVYDHTRELFELIYVDVNSPGRVRRYLEKRARERGFQLISFPYYLTPNEARNEGVKKVKTKYTVFIDNDILVSPGWLGALVGCAEETGAWVVGPLYMESDGREQTIHGTGRVASIKTSNGRTFIDEKNLFKGQTPEGLAMPSGRQQCDLVEFHCMLVRTDVFDRIGPLDEKLLNHREHYDLCFAVREAGGSVYFEPRSVVTYFPPQTLALYDVPYFMLRWSETWTDETLPYFHKKWGLDYDEHASKSVIASWRLHRYRLLPTRLRGWMHVVCGDRLARRAERAFLLPVATRLNRAVVPYILRRHRKQ
jgi:GT2 family glycosyltransferase